MTPQPGFLLISGTFRFPLSLEVFHVRQAISCLIPLSIADCSNLFRLVGRGAPSDCGHGI
jgi:hypothetical protein